MAVEYIETRYVDLNKMMEFSGNPRRGDVDTIVESLEKNGQYRSLVVRDTGDALVVLAGNHTRSALIALGESEARCEIIRCTDAEAKRINLVDNKAADLGDYDAQAILDILKSLEDEGFEGTGYDTDDYDDFLAHLEPEEITLPPQPTRATYSESPEEMEERQNRVENYQPRYADPNTGVAASTELIVVMTVPQRTEAISLIKNIREAADADVLPGEIVLDALRAHAGATVGEA